MKQKKARMVERKETKQQSVTDGQQPPTEDQIRQRAYEIYCARNGGPGDELADWLKAEVELKVQGETTR